MSGLANREREVLTHPEVKKALAEYKRDRSLYNLHKLRTWMTQAGLNPREREAMIKRLMKTRRWGGQE